MKISTRLALTESIAAGAVAVLAVVLLIVSQQVKAKLTNNEMAGDILNAVTALRYLTLEYVAGHEARPRAQWQMRNASLATLLAGASGFGGKDDEATLDHLRRTQQDIGRLFAELVADREQGQALDDKHPLTQELEARLTGQITSRAQDMISDALALSESSRRGVLGAQWRVNVAVSVFCAVVLLTFAATWILMLRSVIRPLARLGAGTVVIGAGNLDHRLAIMTRDEIGDLSRAFDEMVTKLKNSTVSRAELEKTNHSLQREIAERKHAEEELRQRTEELARSNQDLEQFAYVASHDLQEPLRAVAGPLQLLQRRYQGQLDARADEFIGHAVDGAMRMQRLIDDLLSYSRVGRLEDPQEDVDSGEVLSLALKNLTVVANEAGASVTHDVMPSVRAIPTQLTLLFQNLIGNAIKFRGQDRPPHVHVGVTSLAANGWQFAVKDNGIGIDAQYFERIFLIFQRLHTRREYPGTGLGLALCKRIVEHHGGRIWVESTPGEGTTFFFTLCTGPG